MQIQSVKTNNANQLNFKANYVIKVEKRVYDTLNRTPIAERANLAQKIIDIVDVFKKGVSVVGNDSDTIKLHFGSYSDDYVCISFNQNPLARLKLDEDMPADLAAMKLFETLPVKGLSYYDVIPRLSTNFSAWIEGKAPNTVRRALYGADKRNGKNQMTSISETKTINEIMSELREIYANPKY